MATDYGHEQAVVTAFVNKRISGMLSAISAPLPRLNLTYELRAARGELFGAPAATNRLRSQELGHDLGSLVKEEYLTNKGNNSRTRSYDSSSVSGANYLGIAKLVQSGKPYQGSTSCYQANCNYQ